MGRNKNKIGFKYKKLEGYIKVTLSNGIETLISHEDEEILSEFTSWVITGSKSKYVHVSRYIDVKYGKVIQSMYLHKLIYCRARGLQSTTGTQVDHKDRDRLNNQRTNLRMCTSSQNMGNVARKTISKSGYRGVTFQKRSLKKPFVVHIAGKNIGYYSDKIEAAKAYDNAAKKRYGEFAMLNFPEDSSART